MMTPGCFVYLTPEKAKLLLSEQSVKGHPGDPEYAMEITADELLNQEVSDASFLDGAWHLLSDEIREMAQKPPTLDQGVTMCPALKIIGRGQHRRSGADTLRHAGHCHRRAGLSRLYCQAAVGHLRLGADP
jgi:hypothetical protein